MGHTSGLLLQSKADAILSNQRFFSFLLSLRELNFGRLVVQSLLSVAEQEFQQARVSDHHPLI